MSANYFKIGKKYKTRMNFVSGEYQFTRGEKLAFKGEGYIPYDSSYSFRFQTAAGEEKFWILRDDAPRGTWKKHFKPVGILSW